MTTKKLIIAAALVLAGTSASLAQGYGYYGAPYGYGYYNYAPAYSYGWPRGSGWYENDLTRGGPGPRVQGGSGMGIGAQR